MSHKSTFLAVVLMGGLLTCAGGCLLPFVEGAKAGHVAMEGDYEMIVPLAPGALNKYKGYRMGPCSWMKAALPEDTADDKRAEAQKQLDDELKIAREIVAILPDRYDEYMVDDAKIHLGATPALSISVRDVRVTKRHGLVSVALPKVEVTAVVTLSDALTGQALASANVSGHTSSLVLGTPRQLANFLGRGTAKWINEKRQP